MSAIDGGKEMVTRARLLELLIYNPFAGHFCWLVGRRGTKAGKVAGYLRRNGYRSIGIDGRLYLVHRLAWLYVTGQWPVQQIDHINGLRHDNRWLNLRAASPVQNSRNAKRRSINKSGAKGVRWHKRSRKWNAEIRVNGRQISLGYFDTLSDAAAAYSKASNVHHQEFSCVSR